ncbi:hypothetical protein DXT99_26375 [Pontibacter diazotrophicus]|uniref:non-specific protein-tyrosine kinase n=1 Tax=Pontibacter diazotrophicus TaxID=1400979 RepID=A0A3D8KYU3_9BACT|nr:polysaccharide biosynthesis tyrosine autokinase [Pontibacter diazotrophicus]RDV10394.1 hypothetical protein DXT99_26375 [Pontibacter diazotrophicus]
MENNSLKQQEAGLDIPKLLNKVLANWLLLSVCLLIGVLGAYMVNRYTVPQFEVNSSVMLNPSTNEASSATALLYGDELFQNSNNLTNESIILRSKALALQTLRNLDFDVSYFKRGNIKLTEVYKYGVSYKVTVDTSSANIPYDVLFKVLLEDNHYELSTENQSWSQHLEGKKYLYGEVQHINGFTFNVISKAADASSDENEHLFKINRLNQLAGRYAGALSVNPNAQGASVLQLKLTSATPEKEVDYLNQHMLTYRQYNLDAKNTNAVNTISFIDEQLQQISDSLYFIESRLELFKRNNTAVDIKTAGGRISERVQGLEQQKAEFLLNEQYYKYLRNYLQSGPDNTGVVVPANFGITDPILNNLIEQLVSLQAEITVLAQNNSQSNPLLLNQLQVKRQQLQELKQNLQENLSNLQAANQIALRELNQRIASESASLNRLPAAERQLVNINRLYNLSENLYVLLMQKKAEAGIAKAANTSNVTILTEASKGIKVSPNDTKNYLTGILLGLAIPIAFIFLKDFLNTKVNTAEDITTLTTIPLLGMVGHNQAEDKNLIDQSPKSAMAEAFRTVRSNLRFMTSGTPSQAAGSGKIYVVTSSISGEGKTFSAKNLAYILAISGERTLLINADMRKPNSNVDFGVTSSVGLSNFLAGHAGFDEIIYPTLQSQLYILPSGDIPPNPSELLLNKRMEDLIAELKIQYDYIIVDTPPVGILSDGFELMQLADANIFMVRQGYTQKVFLNNIQQQYASGKIRNTAILFNDVDYAKLTYGYGYGYGYGYYAEDQEQAKKWWKRVPMLKN